MQYATYYWLIFNGVMALVTLLIIAISPNQKIWSRFLMISLVTALGLRYLYWRISSTLDSSNILAVFLSLFLLFFETFIVISNSFQTLLVIGIRCRNSES